MRRADGAVYPFVAEALNGEPRQPAPGPYAVTMFFTIGLLITAVPANWLLMKRPLDGREPVDGADYWKAPVSWHLAGSAGRSDLVHGWCGEFSGIGRAPCGTGSVV